MPETEIPITVEDSSSTNIQPHHQEAFDALVSGEYDNFALFSCFMNGQPTCAISSITKDENNMYLITPLFVAVTEDMVLTDHDGVPSKEN